METFKTSEKIKEIIQRAYNQNASDIHLHPEVGKYLLKYRIDGLLVDIQELNIEETALLISSIKVMSKLDIAQKRIPQDGSFKMPLKSANVDLRVSTVNTIKGEKIVLRLFRENPSIKTFKELGLNQGQQQIFKELLNIKSGMLLVTGPTGSGKTTTLYTALSYIKDNTKNYITIEDPVEYQLDDVTQINVDAKIGLDFPKVLRAVLRQDPDGILIGEIRDKETAEIAIRASLTGHIVLTTLHTEDCQSAILRLVDMGIERYLLSGALKGIISQRLVRVSCGCEGIDKDCRCNGTGYFNRTGIFELLPVNDSMRTQIIEGKRNFKFKDLYLTLKEAGQEKVREGITDTKEIYRVIG
ncbi:type II/IV secretion system protein [Alkalicella caledoniensis]|uniref:Type II/IV secretion system protein n=1 Tax=Alkalicella caledoniensis TaxID=2731377 RepID=A0A7G9WBN0_ALKCA|nr:GspE/PulE family protein [Alkalicella caledoniensis]QNO16092.1 type II/IV secretion system protein [Alkalicella caledoniensis]